uniref:CSON000025 protein n=2 Tax=Culicoides sonorensis TaxID=179676 RepID=A0A336MHV4_CULSO
MNEIGISLEFVHAKNIELTSLTTLYQRVQIMSLMVIVATISSSLNSRTIVVGFSPFCSWIKRLSPSKVHTDLTSRPSTVVSSNSTPGVKVIVVSLNVLVVFKVKDPSLFLTNSTVGYVTFPTLRVKYPTPSSYISTDFDELNRFLAGIYMKLNSLSHFNYILIMKNTEPQLKLVEFYHTVKIMKYVKLNCLPHPVHCGEI